MRVWFLVEIEENHHPRLARAPSPSASGPLANNRTVTCLVRAGSAKACMLTVALRAGLSAVLCTPEFAQRVRFCFRLPVTICVGHTVVLSSSTFSGVSPVCPRGFRLGRRPGAHTRRRSGMLTMDNTRLEAHRSVGGFQRNS